MHIDIKGAKEKYGKSETTFRNIVREWRKGKHKGGIKMDNGRVLFKVSFLDDKFKNGATSSQSNKTEFNAPSIDDRTLAILENQLNEKDRQIEKLQFLLAQSQENYNKLIQSPEPKKKRWWQRNK
jgi:hypothetical protein